MMFNIIYLENPSKVFTIQILRLGMPLALFCVNYGGIYDNSTTTAKSQLYQENNWF